jgi:hypothetical protein
MISSGYFAQTLADPMLCRVVRDDTNALPQSASRRCQTSQVIVSVWPCAWAKMLRCRPCNVLRGFDTNCMLQLSAELIDAHSSESPVLPHYSSDLNPLEQLSSKIKHSIRKAIGRTIETLDDALKLNLEAIPKQDCAIDVANAR